MDAVSIATSLIAGQRQNTRTAIQTEMLKSQQQQQRAVVDLVTESAANLARLQAGAGQRIDRLA